jgi:hypothetical protein
MAESRGSQNLGLRYLVHRQVRGLLHMSYYLAHLLGCYSIVLMCVGKLKEFCCFLYSSRERDQHGSRNAKINFPVSGNKDVASSVVYLF